MNFLFDEMHAPSIADALTERSWDVVAVAAEAELRGLSDEDLLAHAAAGERDLVTVNVADPVPFSTYWTGESRGHAGLIFAHPERFN